MSTAKKLTDIGSALDSLIEDHDARRVRIDARREFVAQTTVEFFRRLEELRGWMQARLEELGAMENEELALTGEYSLQEEEAPQSLAATIAAEMRAGTARFVGPAEATQGLVPKAEKANGDFERIFVGAPSSRKN